MMSPRLRIILMIAIIFYYIFLVLLLKRKILNLKYTLLWLFFGFIMLLLVLFPQSLYVFTSLVDIDVAENALFAVILFFLIIVLVSITAIVSKLNEKVRKLIQILALVEKRVREIEKTVEGK